MSLCLFSFLLVYGLRYVHVDMDEIFLSHFGLSNVITLSVDNPESHLYQPLDTYTLSKLVKLTTFTTILFVVALGTVVSICC